MSGKPVLLSFHGSGSNAMIHGVQLARLSRHLNPHFQLEHLEAPFETAAGPGVLPFFEGCGPYKLWISPSEQLSAEGMRSGAASPNMPAETEALIKSAITKAKSENTKVVGLIGFSQGTRLVAGLLKGQEIRKALLAKGLEAEGTEWLDFDFALNVCGSYPPPLLPPTVRRLLDESGLAEDEKKELREARIQNKALHVLGKQDDWLWAGKLLANSQYEMEDGKSKVLEYEMGHQYPAEPAQTNEVAQWVLGTWQQIKEERV